MIKNIVFDFGGVIADIDRNNAVREFVSMGVAEADRLLDAYHQTDVFLSLEEGGISDEDFRKEMEKLCKRPLTWEEVQHAWLGFMVGVNRKKLHLLEALRQRGYRLYVLSNTNPYIMGWARSEHFTEEGKPLDSYFDKLYLSYLIGYTKPDRRIFEYLLKDANILPEETLFVDDGKSNTDIASDMGFRTFRPDNATDWCDRLEEILKQ